MVDEVGYPTPTRSGHPHDLVTGPAHPCDRTGHPDDLVTDLVTELVTQMTLLTCPGDPCDLVTELVTPVTW